MNSVQDQKVKAQTMQTAVFVAQGYMTEQQSDDRWIIRPEMHIHIIGIGGAGMSAIAHVLLGRGITVSGSDMQANGTTLALQAEGATVYQGHKAANIAGADEMTTQSAPAILAALCP